LDKQKYCSRDCFLKSCREQRKCEWCGDIFEILKSRTMRCCSQSCSQNLQNKIAYTRYESIRRAKQCKYCQEEFIVVNWNKDRQFCSKKCKTLSSRVSKTSKYCEICNKEFSGKPYQMTSKRKFCSVKCLNIHRSNLAGKNRKYTQTKPELYFMGLLDKNNIEYEFQYRVKWKRGWKKFYDFYIPGKHLLVEIDGIYWHGKNKMDGELNNQQTKTRQNDIIKNELAKKRGYNLMRVWEDEIRNFNMEELK